MARHEGVLELVDREGPGPSVRDGAEDRGGRAMTKRRKRIVERVKAS